MSSESDESKSASDAPEPTWLPIVHHPESEMDLGDHVFPTDKYAATLELLRAEGWAADEAIVDSPEATRDEILLVHTPEYLDDLESLRWSARTVFSELPLTEDVVRGFRRMTGGTILAARLALEGGAAMHVGGGFHHAFADHAEGFCYLNDVAIAIRVLMREGRIRRAAVIDVDLHQGNGTAHVFQDDPHVLTFSIHQEWIYPEKERSDIDVGLPSFITDDEYLKALGEVVPEKIAGHMPELVVYVAGADPFHDDRLGDLKLSLEGLARRDRLVARACRERAWPMVAVTAGGYARRLEDTARIHANTAIEMAKAWERRGGAGA